MKSTIRTITDRRSRPDRRERPTGILSALGTPGNRRSFRRGGEGLNAYVDVPSPRVMAWVVLIALLSSVDALLTLLHLQAGGAELVPSMNYALSFGPTTFVATKMAFTVLGALFLTFHERFTMARLSLRWILAMYCALMVYHVIVIAVR